MSKKHTVVQPAYVRAFQCDGAACGAACCKIWRVNIGAHTYRAYQTITDEAFRKTFDRYVKPNAGAGHDNYARIELTDKGACPFLREDLLCMIQRDYGAERLSDVCREFPRYIREIDGEIEVSLDLSCPVAAKLALTGEKPLAFERYASAEAFSYADSSTDLNSLVKSAPVLGRFKEIRAFALELLQARFASLEERIRALRAFLTELDELVTAADEHQIPALIAARQKAMRPGKTPRFASAAQSEAKLSAALARLISESGASDFIGDELRIAAKAFRAGQDGADERYGRAANKYFPAFLRANGHIYENFLVNEAFRQGFPFFGVGKSFSSRGRLFAALYFSLPKYVVVGLETGGVQVTPERFIRFIASFLRAVSSDDFVIRAAEIVKRAD